MGSCIIPDSARERASDIRSTGVYGPLTLTLGEVANAISDETIDLADMIETLIHEADVAALPECHGAPLHVTTGYYTPDELTAAFARWQQIHGRVGSIPDSHMWHAPIIGALQQEGPRSSGILLDIPPAEAGGMSSCSSAM